jgi:hypothetical protein
MITSFVLPHFWVEAISTVTYLINIQPSSTLQGGIPFEHLCNKMSDYSSLCLFGCVCYVLLAPRERTKLTTQSVECVFLGYSAEHKSYHYSDPVACRMRMSQDVVFDESRPFYSHPTTDASSTSLVDHLSFLLFPDAPPATLPIPHSTLPSSVSSSEFPPVVSDYTVKPLVTQFYSHRGACLSDALASSDELSFDVSSSSIIKDVPSSPPVEPSSLTDSSLEQLVRHSHHLRRPPDCYSPSAFTVTAILHPEWQHATTEEITAHEQTDTWDLVPCPPRVHPITCKWVYKVKTRSDGLLSAIRLVSLLVVFSRSKLVIIMRLLLLLLI